MASIDLSLQAGLTALKQEDYKRAITILEDVCQAQGNAIAIFRARMGLVVAYQHTNQICRAIDVCQVLVDSDNQQVKTWALRHLTTLSKNNDTTGFVAFLPENRIQNPESRSQDSEIRKQNSEDKNQENRNHKSEVRKQNLEDKTHTSEVRKQNLEANAVTPHPSRLIWRQAARARHWQPLPKINLVPFWLLQLGTAIAFFWLLRGIIVLTISAINALFVKLPYLEPIQLFYRDPTQFVAIALLLLGCLSPWLLDGLLKLFYNLQPLSTQTLSSHSPEALRVLQRYCRQRGWKLPNLQIMPLSAPLAFTYGNLPKTTRIVVSQGLLTQLAPDEVATIYAAQLAHIAHGDLALMSLITLLTTLPYTIYQQSPWADNTTSLLRHIAAVIASVAYALWYILSLPALLLSQVRIYYSDRLSTDITGNPNALQRALVKIAHGITADIHQQTATNYIWESYHLLIPICYRQAINISSCDSLSHLENCLSWDCLNPARYLLNINNTHPLIGDRLQRLAKIADNWHLATEVNITNHEPKYSWQKQPLLIQGAPFFGIVLGFACGCFGWLIGIIGNWLQIPQLAWMYGDSLLILGCLPIGFSIGTFMRINALFPDIKYTGLRADVSLTQLLSSTALPIDSKPIRLQGTLLGRRGISNWLAQNLILDTHSGLIILHHQAATGFIGKVLSRRSQLANAIGENVIVTGWFRRGATAWVDIDTLRTHRSINRSAHPIWSTLLASTAAVVGTYIILQGGK